MIQRRKMQHQSWSADVAEASGAAASGGPDGDASGGSSGVLKTIWKKAIGKLALRRSKSEDPTKSSAHSANTNAGTP